MNFIKVGQLKVYSTLLKSWVNLVGQLMVAQRCVTLAQISSIQPICILNKTYSTVRHTLNNSLGILMLGTFNSYSRLIFIFSCYFILRNLNHT